MIDNPQSIWTNQYSRIVSVVHSSTLLPAATDKRGLDHAFLESDPLQRILRGEATSVVIILNVTDESPDAEFCCPAQTIVKSRIDLVREFLSSPDREKRDKTEKRGGKKNKKGRGQRWQRGQRTQSQLLCECVLAYGSTISIGAVFGDLSRPGFHGGGLFRDFHPEARGKMTRLHAEAGARVQKTCQRMLLSARENMLLSAREKRDAFFACPAFLSDDKKAAPEKRPEEVAATCSGNDRGCGADKQSLEKTPSAKRKRSSSASTSPRKRWMENNPYFSRASYYFLDRKGRESDSDSDTDAESDGGSDGGSDADSDSKVQPLVSPPSPTRRPEGPVTAPPEHQVEEDEDHVEEDEDQVEADEDEEYYSDAAYCSDAQTEAGLIDCE